MESPQAFSEEMVELVTKRTERLEKVGERWASRFEPAAIAETDFEPTQFALNS